MAISLTNEKNTVYAKGDVCLNINPFDNYRMFTLYENWKDDNRKTLDVSGNQSIYLVFKTKKKEIRIPEYDTTNSGYKVDKANGQVLFKISKKNAVDILDLDGNNFYITRVYETTDSTGNNVLTSEEEVLYTGKWKNENSTTETENYTSKIKQLLSTIDDRNNQIQELQASNAELMKQNVNLASELEEAKAANDELNQEITTLEEKVAAYESGETYDGTILDDNGTVLHITSEKEYTEEEWQEIVKNGLETLNI